MRPNNARRAISRSYPPGDGRWASCCRPMRDETVQFLNRVSWGTPPSMRPRRKPAITAWMLTNASTCPSKLKLACPYHYLRMKSFRSLPSVLARSQAWCCRPMGRSDQPILIIIFVRTRRPDFVGRIIQPRLGEILGSRSSSEPPGGSGLSACILSRSRNLTVFPLPSLRRHGAIIISYFSDLPSPTQGLHSITQSGPTLPWSRLSSRRAALRREHGQGIIGVREG